jgi:hypothetical protein
VRVTGEMSGKFLQKMSRLLAHPLFGAGTLLAIQARFLWGSWHNWDLPLWDGSVYYINGRTLLSTFQFPSLEWSPLFAIYYAAFQAFLGRLGPLLVYYTHRLATQAILLLLLYWLLRKMLHPLTAWMLGAYFILLWVPVTNAYVVHNFILIPMLAAYLFALHPGRTSQGLVLAALLLASMVRTEMLLALVAYVLFLALRAIRQHQFSIEWRDNLSLASACALTLIIFIRTPVLSTNRLWAAFGQHYAWGYSERNPEWGLDPWLHWQEITRLQFDGAQSLWQAIRANPPAVTAHIAWNLHILPGELNLVLRPFYPWLEILLWIGLIGLAIAAIPGFLRRRTGSKIFRASDPSRLSFWTLLIASLLPGVFSLLIIRPRAIYMVVFLPAILLIAGLGLDRWLPARIGKSGWVIAALAAICLILFPSPFAARAGRPVLSLSNKLAHYPLNQSFTLLSESAKSFCVYAQPGLCQPLEISQVPAQTPDFAAYLNNNHVDVIISNTRLIQNLPVEGQKFIARLQSDPAAEGFDLITQSGDFSLFLRKR